MTQSSILVVGATGQLGTRLVGQLSAAGVKPRALVRSWGKGEAIASMAKPLVGDLTAPLAPMRTGSNGIYLCN